MTLTRGRRTRPAAAVLVLVLATAALAACSHSTPEARADAGDVMSARGVALGHTATVRVPSGVVTVSIGAPQAEMGPGYGHPDGPELAPSGGSWVPVGLTYAPDHDAVSPPLPFDQLDRRPPTFSVRTSSGTYPLGQPTGDMDDDPAPGVPTLLLPDRFAVAVPDAHPQAQVLVTYDGFSQVVSADGSVDRGNATALSHRPVRVAASSCRGRWSGARPLRAASCRVSAGIAPYDSRAGWAPAGRQWLLLDLDVDFGVLPESNGILYDETRARFLAHGDLLTGSGAGRVVSGHSQQSYAGAGRRPEDAQRVEVWSVPGDFRGGTLHLDLVVHDPKAHRRFAVHTTVTLTRKGLLKPDAGRTLGRNQPYF